jgi:uncharacterized protein YecT (DUF1311 family)
VRRPLNQQARDEFLKADQRLNAVFSSLIAKVSAARKASLRDAEKTWIRFRDQECAFETMGSGRGSGHPMVVSKCKSRLAIQHTRLPLPLRRMKFSEATSRFSCVGCDALR